MINRSYKSYKLSMGTLQLSAEYECENGWLLYEFFSGDLPILSSAMLFLSEVKNVVAGLKDSFERSGNECLVMGNREYTFIYDKYASSQEEYENTKCQLSTSDFLFLFEEWIEKKGVNKMAMKNDYNECLSDAIRHIKARNIGDALNKLFTAQKLQPDNPRAFTLAGTAYQLAGNYNEAEHYYSKALALDKNNGARYFELANAQYALMRYSEAIANYAKAEQLKCPDDMMYEIYYIMGVYNQFVSDSKDKFAKNQSALLNYNKAEEISSCSKHKRDILTYKIQIFFESGDYDNATSCALQLKYLSPQEFNTYKLLSQLMLIQGKVSEAEMYLNEADKNCPNFAQMQILVERINVLEIKAEISAETDSRYYDQAISLCDLVIESHAVPLAVTYHVTMKKASIMLKNKDFDGAIKTCTEIANEDKSDVMSEIEKARFILVECYVSKKNFLRL